VKTTTAFDKVSGWACAEYKGPRCDASLRLDVKKGFVPYFNQKVLIRHGDLQVGYVAKLNLQNFTLRRYNAFAAYNVTKDLTFFLEHVSRNQEKLAPGRVILATLFRKNKSQYVARASYRPWRDNNQFRFVLGALTKVNNNTDLRAKVDSNAKLALSTKYRVSDNLNVVAGTSINLMNPGSYLTNRLVPIPLGLSIEFSYV
jgi:hypothetical protein